MEIFLNFGCLKLSDIPLAFTRYPTSTPDNTNSDAKKKENNDIHFKKKNI